MAVSVTIRPGGILEVTDDSPTVGDLAALPRRFCRHKSDGFGLGLHICNQIVDQAGGLNRTHFARTRGRLMARVSLPGSAWLFDPRV